MILHLHDLELELTDPFGVIYGLKSPSGKWYIGQTTQNINLYIRKEYYWEKGGLRTKISRAINKYGIDSFRIFILHECNSIEELNKKEEETIEYYNSMINGYNCSSGGLNFKMSSESIESMRKTLTGRVFTKEWKKRLSESRIGMVFSDETKKKMSEAKIGKRQSKEQIENRVNILTGMKRSKESKRNISESLIGHLVSDETKKKMSEAKIGKIISEDTKKKMSESHKKIPKDHTYIYVFTILNPDGLLLEVKSLNSFCKSNSLTRCSLLRHEHKGFKIIKRKNIKTGIEESFDQFKMV